MSLYNMIHGFNTLAGPLLSSLGLYLPSATIDRFRDASLYNKDRDEKDYLIRIITRTGGPNRDSHRESIDKLTKHEYFLKEEDDSSDPTYMYFFFKLPPGLIEDIKAAEEKYPGRVHATVDNDSLEEKMNSVLGHVPTE
jgi:hypothetical protein